MKRFIKRVFITISLSTLTMQFSCAPTPQPHLKIGNSYAVAGQYYTPEIQPAYREVGLASWYGPRFHKKLTANGEIFNRNDFTAAHKTLPLPSIVKVTNLNNGRTIRVRVNDRGPFIRGRIIDMSDRAAAALGFKSTGTAKVLVELDREASLELLKEPGVRVKEAEKKRLVEAYTRYSMPSSKNYQESQSINLLSPIHSQPKTILVQTLSPIQSTTQEIKIVKKPLSQQLKNQPLQASLSQPLQQQLQTQQLQPQQLQLPKKPQLKPKPLSQPLSKITPPKKPVKKIAEPAKM
jgi:rare lipoprotein A (peptidoglycan hydrolase)